MENLNESSFVKELSLQDMEVIDGGGILLAMGIAYGVGLVVGIGISLYASSR